MTLDAQGRRILFAIFIFATLTRGLYLWLFVQGDPLAGYPIHDAELYDRWARAWADGQSWGDGPFYQAPLYPLLLSLVYRLFDAPWVPVYLLQSLAGLGSLWLVFRVAMRAFGQTPALCAAGLAAFYGVWPFYETKLLPAALASLATLWVVDRLQVAVTTANDGPRFMGWSVAGASIGIAALLRPNLLLIAGLTALWILVSGLRGKGPGVRVLLPLLAACALVILPVTLRNMSHGDPVLISSNGGVTFYQGNHSEAQGVFTAVPETSGSILSQQAETRALAERDSGFQPTAGNIGMKASAVSRYWFGRAIEEITADPAEWLALEGNKLWLSFDNYEHALEYNPQLDPNPLRWLLVLPFWMVLALVVLRIGSPRRLEDAEVPLWIAILSVVVTLLLFFAVGRYRLPAMGPFFAVAGFGLCGVLFMAGEVRRNGLGVLRPQHLGLGAVVLLAATISYTRLPLMESIYLRGEAMGHADIGAAWSGQGKSGKAIAAYRRSLELNGGYPYSHLDLALALKQSGDVESAEKSMRKAIELAPKLIEAQQALGTLLYEQERFDESADVFREAIRQGAVDPAIWNNYLRAALNSRRVQDAMRTVDEMSRRGIPLNPTLADAIRRMRGGR